MRTSIAVTAMFALALASCSKPDEGEGADDFAARVGAGSATASPAPVETAAVVAAPAAGTDVLNLEQLGNVAAVDLGARDGGCTFSSGGVELLMAAGSADAAVPGRGVVRAGGQLYQLAAAGGLPAIRQGTRFSGEGITIDVAGSGQAATLTVTDGAGQSKALSGSWICS